MKKNYVADDMAWVGCGFVIGMLSCYTTIGMLCFEYVLKCTVDKDIPWYADVICGFFGGGIAIPGALICWILQLCDMEIPFF